MKIQRTPKLIIDEQLFTNPLSENIDETKVLTSAINVLKPGKTSSYSDI